MSLIKWSPFYEPFEGFDKMLEEMNALAPRGAGGIVPPVDVYETADAVVIETPVAGMDPNQIEVSIENGVLTIKGTSERKTEVDDKNYYRKEVRRGSVFRQVALPASVEEGKASASYENGILKISAPKAQAKKAIKIDIEKK
jgi:HSP20 family protein